MISVVIPVYNQRLEYFKQAVNSALLSLSLTDFDYEVIVVDDGSKLELLSQYEYFIERLQYCRLIKKETNGGVSSALNIGIRESQYDYIAWLSSDDYLDPNKFVIQMRQMIENHAKFSYTGFNEIAIDNGEIKHFVTYPALTFENTFKELIKGDYSNSFINGASIIVEKDLFNKVGLFDEELMYQQDYDMWIRLSNETKPLGINLPLLTKRFHNNQMKYIFENTENNETLGKIKDYIKIKSKWEDSIYPITHPFVSQHMDIVERVK